MKLKREEAIKEFQETTELDEKERAVKKREAEKYALNEQMKVLIQFVRQNAGNVTVYCKFSPL